MDDKYDETLFEILKDTKTIPKFFDTIFGFLFRRTDFYTTTTDPNLGVGLPPGVAEKYVKQAYLKHVNLNNIVNSPKPKEVPIPSLPPIAQEETVVSEATSTSAKETTTNKTSALAESYNGASNENYSWTQSITDVDIQVKFPEKFNFKQLSVNVTSTNISIKTKDATTIYLEDELCQKCKHLDTIWSIDGNILQIHLEKIKEGWWDCLIKTEKKLDLSKMDCSRPFYELSEEAQAKIEELTWNQDRKRQGLPTSDQMKLEDTLKKAWNADGSPFSGDYDPMKVQFN